jgi:hypothetical protein
VLELTSSSNDIPTIESCTSHDPMIPDENPQKRRNEKSHQ